MYHTCVDLGTMPGVGPFSHCLGQGLFSSLLCMPRWLASSSLWFSCVYPPFPSYTGTTDICASVFLCGFLGPDLRSSGLCSKHFTQEAVSPDPKPFYKALIWDRVSLNCPGWPWINLAQGSCIGNILAVPWVVYTGVWRHTWLSFLGTSVIGFRVRGIVQGNLFQGSSLNSMAH